MHLIAPSRHCATAQRAHSESLLDMFSVCVCFCFRAQTVSVHGHVHAAPRARCGSFGRATPHSILGSLNRGFGNSGFA